MGEMRESCDLTEEIPNAEFQSSPPSSQRSEGPIKLPRLPLRGQFWAVVCADLVIHFSLFTEATSRGREQHPIK